MKIINGIKLNKLGFEPQKIGDLLYHEGPLLSLFTDKNNPELYYIYKWADCNDSLNRWMVIQVNAKSLRSFFFGEISLKNLFLNTPLTYLVDLDDNLKEVEITACATNQLPMDYLPNDNSFFTEEKYSEFAGTFKTMISNNRIYEMLNEILNEVVSLKKSQTNTDSLLKVLLNQ